MSNKRKKNSAGLQINGNINVKHGDFIAGEKNIKIENGGVYTDGDIRESNIVIGDNNHVGNQEDPYGVFFAELFKQIEQHLKTSLEDKEDLKANIAEIKVEAEKGDHADESFLSRRLRNIERIAPDIADVVIATLSNPVFGIAQK